MSDREKAVSILKAHLDAIKKERPTLTDREIADESGVSMAEFSLFMKGSITEAKFYRAARFLRYLGIRLDWFASEMGL
jgi:transcriptional regulator with XRE-family HTH domain